MPKPVKEGDPPNLNEPSLKGGDAFSQPTLPLDALEPSDVFANGKTLRLGDSCVLMWTVSPTILHADARPPLKTRIAHHNNSLKSKWSVRMNSARASEARRVRPDLIVGGVPLRTNARKRTYRESPPGPNNSTPIWPCLRGSVRQSQTTRDATHVIGVAATNKPVRCFADLAHLGGAAVGRVVPFAQRGF